MTNMGEPLPETKLEDRKVRAAYLLTGINGESVRMNLAHLVQVLAALTGEQIGAVVRALPEETRLGALGEMARSLVLFHCERADQEKARAERAERRVRVHENIVSVMRLTLRGIPRQWAERCVYVLRDAVEDWEREEEQKPKETKNG